MQVPWQSIQGFSGATAVGALTLVGLALIANAFATSLFPAIDSYARLSPTWAIVVAVPLLALCYLLGLLSNGAAEAVMIRVRLIEENALIEDPVIVSSRGEFVTGRFQQLHQEGELLAGSAVALFCIAIGSALSAWPAGGWRRFLTAIAFVAIMFAVGSVFLSRSRYASAHRLALTSTTPEKEIAN